MPTDAPNVDADRLLPRGLRSVAGTDFGLHTGPVLGSRELDHAFIGLRFDRSRQAHATLRAADGYGVRMTWDDTCPWLQVHTTDLPGQAVHRRAGVGLVRLAPGAVHTAAWAMRAVGPDPPTG